MAGVRFVSGLAVAVVLLAGCGSGASSSQGALGLGDDGSQTPGRQAVVVGPSTAAAVCAPTITLSKGPGIRELNYVAEADDADGCGPATFTVGSNTNTMSPGAVKEDVVDAGCATTVTVTIMQNGASDTDQETTGFAAPMPPTAPRLVEATPTSLRAAWTANVDACHPIDSFVLQANTGASIAVTDAAGTLSGLAPATSYTLTAVAVNAKGRTSGAATAMKTAAAAVVKPSAPTGVTTSAIATTSARVSWTAPAAGSSPITGYLVTLNGSSLGVVSATQRDFAALAPGTAYSGTVAAVSAAGTGPASSFSFRTATPAPTATARPTAPATPAPVTTPQPQTITLATGGPAWRSGKAHIVGAQTTSAGVAVTWSARGKAVKSVLQTTKSGQAALVITLKPGTKPARVTIIGSAPATSTHAPVMTKFPVTVKR